MNQEVVLLTSKSSQSSSLSEKEAKCGAFTECFAPNFSKNTFNKSDSIKQLRVTIESALSFTITIA